MNNNLKQPEKVVQIDTISAFSLWRKELRTIRRQDDFTCIFNLPDLSETENKNLTNLVKSYNNECGCQSGSLFMSLTFGATIAYYFISGGRFSAIRFQEILLLLGITLLGALTGKFLGLILARWRLIRLSNKYNEKFSTANLSNLSTNQ